MIGKDKLITSVMISRDIETAPRGIALARNPPCAQPAISPLVSKMVRDHDFDNY